MTLREYPEFSTVVESLSWRESNCPSGCQRPPALAFGGALGVWVQWGCRSDWYPLAPLLGVF